MKRLISLILVIATMLSLLAGCAGTKDAMQMGVWLDNVVTTFGMTEYETAEPLFPKVPAEDPYFGAFQIAAEWEVLTPDDSITSSSRVTWRDVLVTLVNVGFFLDDGATEDEKIDYAIRTFDPEIRKYWLDRTIGVAEAMPLLDKAADLWANSIITETVEQVQYTAEVLDLAETVSDYDSTGDVVIVDASQVGDLKPGDVYSLPSIDGKAEASVNRVLSVERDGDKLVITNDPEFEGEEVSQYVEEIDIQKNVPVDFSYITGIYDANGNPLFTADTGVNTELASTSGKDEGIRAYTLESNGNETLNASNLKFFNIKDELTFKAGDFRINLEFEDNDFKLTLSKVDYDQSAKRTKGFEPFIELNVKDLSLDKKVKYNGVTLDTAYAKLNYTQSISGGVKFKNESEVGKIKNGDGNTWSEMSTILREYKAGLAALGQEVNNTSYAGSDIYLCRIALGASGIDFIVKGRISCTGEVKITVTMQGSKGIEYKSGKLRYISSSYPSVDMVAEGKFEITIGPGFEVKILKIVTVTATLDVGVGAKLTYTAHLLDIENHCFLTADATLTADQAAMIADATKTNFSTSSEEILAVAEAAGGTWNNYEPNVTVSLISRTCLDWYLYPIVKITGELDVNFGKVFGKKVGFEKSCTWKISDDDNTKLILKGHIEFPNNLKQMLAADSIGGGFAAALGIGAECSYTPQPWDPPEDETEPTEETEESATDGLIAKADTIELSLYRVFLYPGQTQQLLITGLPAGYSSSDLVVTMDKSSVADISISGDTITVTAKDALDTVNVVISTSDGKQKAYLGITVQQEKADTFEGLGEYLA